MTKVKLKDATRDLLKGAADMLGNVSSMRKSADELTQAARKLEAKFLREEEQRKAEERAKALAPAKEEEAEGEEKPAKKPAAKKTTKKTEEEK